METNRPLEKSRSVREGSARNWQPLGWVEGFDGDLETVRSSGAPSTRMARPSGGPVLEVEDGSGILADLGDAAGVGGDGFVVFGDVAEQPGADTDGGEGLAEAEVDAEAAEEEGDPDQGDVDADVAGGGGR